MRRSRQRAATSKLPTGTVTFLLTDVEGSTRLWDEQPTEMRRALARHDEVVGRLTREHAGVLVRPRGEGDSRFCVFARASDAVATAVAVQRALHQEPWPTVRPLRVRIALHTGEADLRDADYYGAAVNRCARLRAIARGGQVLLSQATAELVRTDALAGVVLRDLGEHHLRDLTVPEHIFEVVGLEVDDEPPLLQTFDGPPNDLPLSATPFIGRLKELAEVERLLGGTRLLTLTGGGGVGKTRLALQVAAHLASRFRDGARFVDLAPLAECRLVVPAVAKSLHVGEGPARPLEEAVLAHLAEQELLLVLDNFEHVSDSAPFVARLVDSAPDLKVLATSRSPLRIRAEREFAVPPLAVPEATDPLNPAAAAEVEAVALFLERARAVAPGFELTAQNTATVIELCRRLDGLPLAIELAAARSKLLPLDALLARLDHPLGLLSTGARDAPARHRTLRAAIDWTHRLLGSDEQAVFAQLSVFTGGCTLAAAEAVCTGAAAPSCAVLDVLESLVDKSLLRPAPGTAGEPRFSMLETIRAFASDRLAAEGGLQAARDAHLEFFLSLAERAVPELTGSAQVLWFTRLEADHDNLRAALRWSMDAGAAERGLRMGAALWRFWYARGYFAEGRAALAELLRMPGGSDVARGDALNGAGSLAYAQGDYPEAEALHQASLALRRAAGDEQRIAHSLNNLGFVARGREDPDRARALLEDSLAMHRRLGDQSAEAVTLGNLAALAFDATDYRRARVLHSQAFVLHADRGELAGMAAELGDLGDVAFAQGEEAAAGALFAQSVCLRAELGDRRGVPQCLEGFAALAAARGRWVRALRLLGAATAARDAIGAPRSPARSARVVSLRDRASRALGPRRRAAAYAQGLGMRPAEAVAYALDDRGRPEKSVTRTPGSPTGRGPRVRVPTAYSSGGPQDESSPRDPQLDQKKVRLAGAGGTPLERGCV